jgi:hypothetical protein
MQALMCFVVGVGVIFGVAVGPVLGACITVVTKLILGCTATEPPKLHLHHLGPAGDNSFIGTSRGWRIISLDRLFWLGPTHGDESLAFGNLSCTVMNSAARSDSAADAITNLIIWAIERMALLNCRKGSSSDR